MSKTIWLITFGILAVLALGLFLFAARNWSKATALYSAPATEEPPQGDEGKEAPAAPAARQSALDEATSTAPAATSEPALRPSAQHAEERA